MKRILLASLLIAGTAFAGKGSVYSRFGIGEVHPYFDARSAGLGTSGIALLDNSDIGLLNPASVSALTRTFISAGYRFQNLRSADAGASSTLTIGNIGAIALAFPVYAPKQIVLSLGIVPFSEVGYRQQISTPVDGNDVHQTFEGNGGLSSGQLTLTYAPLPGLVLGGSLQYLFGAIYSTQTITFADASFYGGSYYSTRSLGGLAGTLGAIVTGADKMLGMSETPHLDIGALLFSGSRLSMDDETVRYYSSVIDTTSNDGQTVSIPFGLGIGLSYRPNSIRYIADMRFENWGSFAVNALHPAEFQNSVRVGVGAEFEPTKEFKETIWDRLTFRLGAYLRRTDLSINGTSIDELFGTAGISLPVSNGTQLSAAVQYGTRGTTASSLIRDRVLRLTISLSASELMFIQPPIE